jgi:hypothetical protein
MFCVQVYLREQSRGLYSSFLPWMFEDIPVLVLRTIQSLLYGVIVFEILELAGGEGGESETIIYNFPP